MGYRLNNLNSAKWLSCILVAAAMTACGAMDFDPAHQLQSYQAVIHPPKIADAKTANVANSYIVAFRNFADSKPLKFSTYRQEYKFHDQNLVRRFYSDPRIKSLNFITAIDLAKPTDHSVLDDLRMPRSLQLAWSEKNLEAKSGVITRVDFSSRKAAIDLLADWEQKNIIWYAEPNWKNSLTQTTTEKPSNVMGQFAETYAANSASWHWLSSMKIVEGYKYLSDQIVAGNMTESDLVANAPIVAVMDSGVDYEHTYLQDRMWVNDAPGASECPQDLHGCDTTARAKGFLGSGTSIHPYSAKGPGEACLEDRNASNCQHGTHVAGIVAGKATSDGGVPGICPLCKIMVIKIIGPSEDGTRGTAQDSSILNGLLYAARFSSRGAGGVRVLNSSFGKFQRSRSVALIVSRITTAGLGTLVVGAAGNEDTNSRGYPAAFSQAIAVSSVSGDSGEKEIYSNYGPWVDIAAPGGTPGGAEIESTVPGSRLDYQVGTSMAAPMVAGVAGMLLAADPNMTAAQLKRALINSADSSIYDNDLNGSFYYQQVDGAKIPLLGAGNVDLFNALTGGGGGVPIEDFLNSRVASGCGVIQKIYSEYQRLMSNVLLTLLISLPLFVVFVSSRYTSKEGSR